MPPAGLDLENRLEQLGIIPKKVYDIKMIRLGGKGYRASRRLDRRIEGREWLKNINTQGLTPYSLRLRV